MDFATIIGIILGVAVVVGMVVKGADVMALVNPAAALIILLVHLCSMHSISDESTKKDSKII